jgi:CRISPR-associated protein (TIGR02710 family)
MKTLFLTIGTGDTTNPEASLLAPLRKSMRQGKWGCIILLPSHMTKTTADQLKSALSDLPIEVEPLPVSGQEDDADACADHFSAIMQKQLNLNNRPADIVVDMTRGTKVMSAALLLTAVRFDVPTIRYITGPRDQRGMVIAGHEVIHDVQTARATAGKMLDLARNYMRKGLFAAAAELLPDAHFRRLFYPEKFDLIVEFARNLSLFCAAWDRLDYGAACACLKTFPPVTADTQWAALAPPAAVLDHVATLAAPLSADLRKRADQVRLLSIDLLANGERRLRAQQYEDALLRAYRVVDMLTTASLLERGYDTQDLKETDAAVIQVIKTSQRQLTKRNGTLRADRDQSIRILLALDKNSYSSLRELHGKITKRNDSLLTHGYVAAAPRGLEQLYKEIAGFAAPSSPQKWAKALRISRFIEYAELPK